MHGLLTYEDILRFNELPLAEAKETARYVYLTYQRKLVEMGDKMVDDEIEQCYDEVNSYIMQEEELERGAVEQEGINGQEEGVSGQEGLAEEEPL